MSIRCFNCDAADFEPKAIELTGQVRGESYTVMTPGLQCPNCGYKTIEGPESSEFGRKLADAYRAAHGLLTSYQIRARRERLGMNQQQFAKFLGAGIASVKRWEAGKIQDEVSNELIIQRTSFTRDTSQAYYFFADDSTEYSLSYSAAACSTEFIVTQPGRHCSTVLTQYVNTAAEEFAVYGDAYKVGTAAAAHSVVRDVHTSIPVYLLLTQKESSGRQEQS